MLVCSSLIHPCGYDFLIFMVILERRSKMVQRMYPKRCSSSSSLAETVANIEELLTEILVRVPASPLVRFKCVSKHWLSLISDPKFCHRHTLRNPNPPVSAIFCDGSWKFCFIPLPVDHDHRTSTSSNHDNHNPSGSGSGSDSPCNPFNFAQNQYNDDIRAIQSCKGLFLCNLWNAKNLKPPYFVLNPTTNQFSTLTPPAFAVTNDAGKLVEPKVISIALAFDPSKSPHYKVVCLRTIDGSEYGWLYHILIYSSETRSWRLLDSSFFRDHRIDYESAVYFNGAIHWLSWDTELLYFHIDEERIRAVDGLPHSKEKHHQKRKSRLFQESHDGRHLHLIDIYVHCIKQFEVLEMGKDYSGWFVKYLVDLDPICTAYPWFPDGFGLAFLDQDETKEEEECSSLLLHLPGKVISYNLKSNTFKSFELAPKAGVDDSYIRVGYYNYRFMETLACV